MPVQVDAIYENGVLKPLQPLDLSEHERVTVTVTKTPFGPPGARPTQLDGAYIERLSKELRDAAPAPGLDEGPATTLQNTRVHGGRLHRRARGSLILAAYFLDSSAKLYHPEIGTPKVDRMVHATGSETRISRLLVPEVPGGAEGRPPGCAADDPAGYNR